MGKCCKSAIFGLIGRQYFASTGEAREKLRIFSTIGKVSGATAQHISLGTNRATVDADQAIAHKKTAPFYRCGHGRRREAGAAVMPITWRRLRRAGWWP
jgi:hypothetical protein